MQTPAGDYTHCDLRPGTELAENLHSLWRYCRRRRISNDWTECSVEVKCEEQIALAREAFEFAQKRFQMLLQGAEVPISSVSSVAD